MRLLREARQLGKFSLAGAAAILTDYGLYNALALLLPRAGAKALSFTAGGAVAYLINKHWTFAQPDGSAGEVLRFALVNGAGLALNVGVNHLVLRLSGGSANLAFAAAVAVAGTAIYLAQKWWVFRSASPR